MQELQEQLLNKPQRFDFFQAMRLLRIFALTTDGWQPSRPVGEDFNPTDEMVRFRTLSTLRFPWQPISSISPLVGDAQGSGAQQPATSARHEMVVTFMGLTGPHGVLPRHYTQLLIRRIREKDFALRDFLDLFNHRQISLFYRAWEKYQFPIIYEATTLRWPERGRGQDLFTQCLYGITGHGLPGLRHRLGFSDEVFLHYAGLFAAPQPRAVSLQAMLEDVLQLPIGVLQFQGQWLYLQPADQSSLPIAKDPADSNNQLGTNLVLGRRVWDVENRFRIRIGPLSYQQFRAFMPIGDQRAPICQLVRSYVGPGYDFDLQPVLLAAEVPRCLLGDNTPQPSRLGWNAWLRGKPMDHDAEDAVFAHSGDPGR